MGIELKRVEPGQRGVVFLRPSRTGSRPKHRFEQAIKRQCGRQVDDLGKTLELGTLELGGEHREELRCAQIAAAASALELESPSKVPDPRSGERQPVEVVPERLNKCRAQYVLDRLVADADDGVGDEAIDGADGFGQCAVEEYLFGE